MKIHLDTDFGGDIDDLCALALALKWPGAEITGITTVIDDGGMRAGFAKYVLDLAGRGDVSVKAGADISSGCFREQYAYQDNHYWPRSIAGIKNTIDDALELLKTSIERGAVIVAMGALTNFYLLDKKYPRILQKAKLFLSGGYIYPPRQGYPQWKNEFDFNVQADAQAALHVFKNSCCALVPLPITCETFLRRAYLERLKQSDDLGKLITKQAELFATDEGYEEKYGKTCSELPDDIINFQYDPLAVAIALGYNDGIEFQDVPLRFFIDNTWVNEKVDPASDKICRVATKIDGQKFSEFWLETIIKK